MPKQTIAEKLALQSLASSSQPGLALPIEVVTNIIKIYIEDKGGPVWDIDGHVGTPIPLPLLLTSKLVKQLTIPLVYSHIVLHGKDTYLSFIKKAGLESLRHIREITICNVDLGSKSALRAEASAIRSLEKRVVAYMATLSKKLDGRCDSVLPAEVEFVVKLFGRKYISPRRHCYVNRLMKLFSMSTLRVSGYYSAQYFTFDPLHDPAAPWRVPKLVHKSDWQWWLVGEPSHAQLYSAVDTVDRVDLLVNEDYLWSYTERIFNAATSIEAACKAAMWAVTVKALDHPHTFCRGKDAESPVLRFPNLSLPCCSGPCNETVSRNSAILNGLLRSTDDLRAAYKRLLVEFPNSPNPPASAS